MKIVICDDHRMFADALGALVESSGHEVVAVAADPEGAAESSRLHDADVCVMDLNFRGSSLVATLDAIRDLSGEVDVVVLTGHDDEEHRRASLDAGAISFASKALPAERLVALIEGSDDSRTSTSSRSHARSSAASHYLTEREGEVLRGLVSGESTAQIATRLGVRQATARSHVQSVLMKLGVHSRLAAVAYAVEHQLVELAA
jgi:two-component system nitrate/nitrite response regulator NarL